MTTIDLGPADVPLRFTQGDDVSVTVYVGGDRDAYTFAAKLKAKDPTSSFSPISFAVTVGAYDSGDDETPVTCVLTDTQTDTLAIIGTNGYLWDLQWTDGGGLKRTVASGLVTVLDDVT